MTAPTFEFTPEQNGSLDRLAGRMRVVGFALVLLGSMAAAVAALAGAPVSIPGLLAAVLLGLTGWWSAQAGNELRAAARSSGDDIGHLMRALARIGRLYDVQYWMVIGLAILALVTMTVA